MRFIDKKQKLDYLLSLISEHNTGTAGQLANRLCVSTTTAEKYLALLREDGHNIGYCTRRRTYYLINEEKWKFMEHHLFCMEFAAYICDSKLGRNFNITTIQRPATFIIPIKKPPIGADYQNKR